MRNAQTFRSSHRTEKLYLDFRIVLRIIVILCIGKRKFSEIHEIMKRKWKKMRIFLTKMKLKAHNHWHQCVDYNVHRFLRFVHGND